MTREERRHDAERKASAEAARVEAEAAERRLAEQRAEAGRALGAATSKHAAVNKKILIITPEHVSVAAVVGALSSVAGAWSGPKPPGSGTRERCVTRGQQGE